MFKCTSCDYTAEAAGQCPTCNVDLVEETSSEESSTPEEGQESIEETPAE